MKIHGIDGLTYEQLATELQQGGRFVIFQYCISVIVLTFKRPSDIYFVRGHQSAATKGLGFTLLSLVAGWWGIPWGPIFTVSSVATNLSGGKDVTREVVAALNRSA